MSSTPQTSLNFSWQQGAKFSHVLPIDFKPENLYEAVSRKLYPNFTPPANQPGCDNKTVFPFKLLYLGKTIPQTSSNPTDKATFDGMKQTMTIRSIILVVERMVGGCSNTDMVDMDTHVRRFFAELNVELNKIVEHANNFCLLCRNTKNCVKIPCPHQGKCFNVICKNCLPYFYANTNYTIRCSICRLSSDLETFLRNAEFKMLPNGSAKMALSEEFKISHAQFKESIELTRYIDFQICK